MDSQDKDQANIRRREEMLARRFGQALDQVNPEAGVACPDAEILAAYAEQSLQPSELALWEGHFAKCARCRKILRALAASADTPLAVKEVAHLGELVSAARAPVEITANRAERGRRKHLDWRGRWFAPVIGVAAVLVVWFAMRPPWRVANRAESTTLIAQAPKEVAPPSVVPAEPPDRISNGAPVRDQKPQAAPLPARPPAKPSAVNSPAGTVAESRAEAGNAIKKESASDSLAASALQREEKFRNPSAQLGAITPSAPAPPPPLPPPHAITAQGATASAGLPPAPDQAKAAPPPAPKAPGSVNRTVQVTEAVPLVETTNGALGGSIQQNAPAELPLNGRNFQALDKSLAAPEFLVFWKAPSGSTLWRAGKGGRIERSTDAGKTWVSQMSPALEDWLGGTATSEKVGWLVGSHGAVARTTDGSHWKKITPPSAAAEAGGAFPDWLTVTATNKNSAAIVARDGRKFVTSDGGKTWRLQ